MRTVSELASLADVTVRTLHHYDRIGLLTPSGRSASGYRLYDHDDLRRLQQILVWRQLGFSLGEIAELVEGAKRDRAAALRAQRALLSQRLEKMATVLKRVDEALKEIEEGTAMNEDTMFEGFDNTEYAAEAEQRWGDTDAWRQSQERTRDLDDAAKAQIAQEGIDHAKRMADAMGRGIPPTSIEAMDLAEAARLTIDRRFYDCSRAMHVSLGEMYVSDPRFTAYYDVHAEGLAVWFRNAIVANAER